MCRRPDDRPRCTPQRPAGPPQRRPRSARNRGSRGGLAESPLHELIVSARGSLGHRAGGSCPRLTPVASLADSWGMGRRAGGARRLRRRILPQRFGPLWRMRSYLRPYWRPMLLMLVCAGLGVGASIVIPLVTMAIVDGPIQHGTRGDLVPMSLLALGVGTAEAALIFGRRWIQSVTVLRVEREIRDDLYANLQRLPVSFHGRWQTGQLLSRATTDLSTIRRFFGFGAIFLVVNALQCLAVVGLLVNLYWPLGLLVAVTMVPVAWLGQRFGTGYARVSRQVQDQQGDLATLVEESATGIRVIKAFGRSSLLQARFRHAARTLRGSALESI